MHKSIGFKIIEDYINNIRSFEDSLELFKQETRRYAKRQVTWFKNRSRESKKMNFKEAKTYLNKINNFVNFFGVYKVFWFNLNYDKIIGIVQELLSKH